MKNITIICSLACTLILCSYNASAQNPDSSAYYLQQGNDAAANGLYLVASQHYKKALSYDSTNTAIHRGLGKVMVEMHRYEEAKMSYEKVINKFPDDTSAIINLANLNFWTRKWVYAIDYGLKMQEMKTGSHTNYLLGKSYYELEDYARSYKYLQAAANEEPSNAEIPYLLGKSFVDMSNYRSAAPFLEKAIQLDTTKPRWVYECALNFAAIPDDKNAVKYYLLAVERGYKADNEYYENLSISYEGIGQMDKCIELMKQVLEKKPADLELLNSIAHAEFKIGKYQDAIDYWDKILYYDKKNANALYMIGLSYQKKGDKAKGMQLCDEAIKLDPSLQRLKKQKGNIGM